MSSGNKLVRLMKKRELVSYYLLCLEEGKVWNVGEAIDELTSKLGFSRKVAFSIIRRFRKTGLMNKIGELEYKCYGFIKYVEDLYESYARRRRLARGMVFKNASSTKEKDSS